MILAELNIAHSTVDHYYPAIVQLSGLMYKQADPLNNIPISDCIVTKAAYFIKDHLVTYGTIGGRFIRQIWIEEDGVVLDLSGNVL